MELQVHAKNDTSISPSIEEYATTRISKMARYLPTISNGMVEISEEGIRQPDQRFVVQVTLVETNGVVIRAQERAEDMRTAIDRVAEALTNRILRHKGKRYDKGNDTVRKMEPALETDEPEPEQPRRVVKTKQFTVKPMPVDEAIEQMELLGHDFFLFVDSETENSNVLYRRKDGDYGLIEQAA